MAECVWCGLATSGWPTEVVMGAGLRHTDCTNALKEAIKRLRAALLAQATLMSQEADDARGDGRPGDAEFFDMCAADCRDAVKEVSDG